MSSVTVDQLSVAEERVEVLREAFFKLYDAIIVIEECQEDVPADQFDKWLAMAGETTILKQAAKILSTTVGQHIKAIGEADLPQHQDGQKGGAK